MTRAEFAKEMTEYIARGGYLKEGEDIAAWAKRHIGAGTPLAKLWAQICDVATNGFDPEPGVPTARYWKAYCSVCRDGLEGPNHTNAAADAYIRQHSRPHKKGDDLSVVMLEQSQESAKRSRPFVGSHNLPHDTDWD